jgi:hypothetical protein
VDIFALLNAKPSVPLEVCEFRGCLFGGRGGGGGVTLTNGKRVCSDCAKFLKPTPKTKDVRDKFKNRGRPRHEED